MGPEAIPGNIRPRKLNIEGSSVITNPKGLPDTAFHHRSSYNPRGVYAHHYLANAADNDRVGSVPYRRKTGAEGLKRARGDLSNDKIVYKKPGEEYLHETYLLFMYNVPKTHGVDDDTQHGPDGEDL